MDFIKKIRIELYILIFKLLPVKKNKIIFISDLGKSYSCNPKYLSEYISMSSVFDIVWVFDKSFNKKHNIPNNCRTVEYFSIKYLYEILTAKFIVSNTRLPEFFRFEKRKKQIYIQTWHSSIRLKKIEKDAFDQLTPTYVNSAINDSKKIDYIVSGCAFSTEIFKNSFWYDGNILEYGTPRVDYLLKNNNLKSKNRLLKKLNLNTESKYILYAPTFRKNGELDAYNIDYKHLCDFLKSSTQSNWKILFRLHPNLIEKFNDTKLPECCIDVSKYDDIQELLIVSDLLITDYSSCMFDAMYLNKKCILYVNDLDNYLKNNRDLYFNIKDLPFPIAINNNEIQDKILLFDNDNYLKKIEKFKKQIGSFEYGNSCKKILEIINQERGE